MNTVIAWLALATAAAALVYAWKLSQELETARRRLDRYNKALFDASDETRALRAKLDEGLAALRVELMQRTGTPEFRPEMTIREVQLLHPQAGEVLAGFHLGGCSSCAVEPDAQLGDACAQSGVPVEQVVGTLNVLLAGHVMQGPVGNGHLQPFVPQSVKLPNVEVDF